MTRRSKMQIRQSRNQRSDMCSQAGSRGIKDGASSFIQMILCELLLSMFSQYCNYPNTLTGVLILRQAEHAGIMFCVLPTCWGFLTLHFGIKLHQVECDFCKCFDLYTSRSHLVLHSFLMYTDDYAKVTLIDCDDCHSNCMTIQSPQAHILCVGLSMLTTFGFHGFYK